jgi:hypothetical protein
MNVFKIKDFLNHKRKNQRNISSPVQQNPFGMIAATTT